MYAEFVEWVEETRQEAEHSTTPIQPTPRLSREERYAQTRKDALIFFNKKEAFEALAKVRFNKQKLKDVFSGHQVREWAELGEYWKGVKLVMDEVRLRMGGEEGILEFLDNHSEEDLKNIVIQVRNDLGIVPRHEQSSFQTEIPTTDTNGVAALTGKVVAVSFTEASTIKITSEST